MMEGDPRRKGPRSPSAESDDSSHRRRSRKYDRDRSSSPRRSRYRRSRSRERRSGSRERRRNKDATARGGQDWNKQVNQNQGNPSTTVNPGYPPTIHNQYQQPPPPPPNTSQPPPTLLPNYNQGYNNYNYNYNQGYDYAYQQQQPGYRSDYLPQNWPGNNQVPYNSQQPPPAVMPTPEVPARAPVVEPTPPVVPPPASRSDDVKKEAIAAEAKQQKATLSKQRDEYVKKSTTLQRELEILREQCDEIGKESGRENNRIVKENQKLQVEIQTKMKSIHNVIDMLTGIIGDKATVDDLKTKFKNDLPKKRSHSPKDESKKQLDIKTPEKLTQSIINNDKDDKIEREIKKQKLTDDDTKPMYNFVHYDPEMHWCKICDIFPKTAKEYLNHLHSNEHKETCLEKKIVDMPWHPRNGGGTEKEVPFYPGLPTKRTPIKGLQFFSAATAWYCKLCDSWIGDLHCASLHLKSKRHSTNFLRFVEQNPHWETDWMADREKAFSDERQKQMQLELQKQKDDEAQQQQKDVPPAGQSSTSTSSKQKKSKKSKKNKKKSKKRKNKNDNSDNSSSETDNTDSDSDQDMSKSIRVAMRNKMKASTQAILNEEIDYHGIKLKGHWNQKSSTDEMSKKENDDRHMINSLRDKIKTRNDDDNHSKSHDRRSDNDKIIDDNDKKYQNNTDQGLEAWGPKEPPKTFWIKKDDDKSINKNTDIPKTDEIPKPHMGFWTKQQMNIPLKMQDNKNEKDDERERDRYKDDRKYDRRDDKYHRYDSYDRRRRDRDRDRDYYDDRRKDRRNDDSPPSSRRERNYRDNSSPKRGYDKYKDSRRDDESNDESKFEKKTNESASKQKKNSTQLKKSSTTGTSSATASTPSTPTATGSNKSGKLPFIGRLPLFKKKNDDIKTMEKDITPLPYVQSKFEDTPKVPSEIINPPGIVHITKLATPVTLNNSITTTSTKTIQPAMKILVAPPPPILNSPITKQPALSPQQVVDMEIENETEDTIIEESIIDNDNSKKTIDMSSSTTTTTSNQVVYQPQNPIDNPFTPATFIHPPPFVQNPTSYPVNLATTLPPVAFNHPPPSVNYQNIPQVDDGLTETIKTNTTDPSQPLPEDLQEALNIIFPKDTDANDKNDDDTIVDNLTTTAVGKDVENDVMYASMYSGMLGCVGYGPEYMDQPPPEITDDADGDNDEQPETDDLRMLGIDEGDTIL